MFASCAGGCKFRSHEKWQGFFVMNMREINSSGLYAVGQKVPVYRGTERPCVLWDRTSVSIVGPQRPCVLWDRMSVFIVGHNVRV